jgi:hypothetical protein
MEEVGGFKSSRALHAGAYCYAEPAPPEPQVAERHLLGPAPIARIDFAAGVPEPGRGAKQARRPTMSDSFGKRNRDAVKARKAAAHDERRVARNQRRNQRGVLEPTPNEPTDPPIGTGDAGLAGSTRDA